MLHNPRSLLFALVCWVIASPAPAAAEAFLSNKPDEAFVKVAVEAANALLPRGRLRDGSLPAPVTPEERRDGVVPPETAGRIVNLAADTALAQFCGLDWRRLSFHPIMRRERERNAWSDRQLAYIGILHGFVQGQFHTLLQSQETCTGEMQDAVETFFADKRW